MPKTIYSRKYCIEQAKKFKSKAVWRKSDRNSYDAALRHNWMSECEQYLIEDDLFSYTLPKTIIVAKMGV